MAGDQSGDDGGARGDGLAPVLRAALWMTAFTATFAMMATLVRLLGRDLDALEIGFFRNLFGFVLLAPILLRTGLGPALRTGRLRLHAGRAALALAAMYCLFLAFAGMPIADATALTFASPLFATAGAALFLGEQVRLRRWTATLAGFAGVLIVLRPGMGVVQPVAMVALASAGFMAGSMLLVKSLSRTESPTTMVLYMTLIMTPLSLVPALFVWQWPTADQWPLLVAVGVVGTGGQFFLARAFKAAEASAVLPFDFGRLVMTAVLGFLVFGEAPDLWTWVGGAVILAATVYIAHREARIGRRGPAATPER